MAKFSNMQNLVKTRKEYVVLICSRRQMLQNNRKRNFLDCILHLGSSFFQFFKRVGVFVQIMVYLFCNVHLLKSFCKFASHGLFKILVNSLARNERQLNPSSFSTFVK